MTSPLSVCVCVCVFWFVCYFECQMMSTCEFLLITGPPFSARAHVYIHLVFWLQSFSNLSIAVLFLWLVSVFLTRINSFVSESAAACIVSRINRSVCVKPLHACVRSDSCCSDDLLLFALCDYSHTRIACMSCKHYGGFFMWVDSLCSLLSGSKNYVICFGTALTILLYI